RIAVTFQQLPRGHHAGTEHPVEPGHLRGPGDLTAAPVRQVERLEDDGDEPVAAARAAAQRELKARAGAAAPEVAIEDGRRWSVAASPRPGAQVAAHEQVVGAPAAVME